MEGILNQTESRGAVIVYGGSSTIETSVKNHISDEFSKRLVSVEIDSLAYKKKELRGPAGWKTHPYFITTHSSILMMLWHS